MKLPPELTATEQTTQVNAVTSSRWRRKCAFKIKASIVTFYLIIFCVRIVGFTSVYFYCNEVRTIIVFLRSMHLIMLHNRFRRFVFSKKYCINPVMPIEGGN